MSTSISSETELRNIISPYPKMMDKRILPQLDHYCMEIIQHAQLVVFGSNAERADINIFACSDLNIIDANTIELSEHIKIHSISSTSWASLYFLVPGVGHGLRVNGTLDSVNASIRLSIRGAYVHCARAAARSELWKRLDDETTPNPTTDVSPIELLTRSPFLLLQTMNSANHTEMSPRGDQEGFVRLLADKRVFIPERPGNKVAISLRNILQTPKVALLMLIPGLSSCLRVDGVAELTTNPTYLDASTVNGKTPKLGILISHCRFELLNSDALGQVWRAQNYLPSEAVTKFSKVLSAHMNGEGLLGKAATPVIQAVVNHDMKHLY